MATDKIRVTAPISSVRDACIGAMRGCGIELVSKTDSYIKGRTSASLLSWGEEIFIRVQQFGSEVEIEASSEATAQLFDWGKSKTNLQCFFSALKKRFKED